MRKMPNSLQELSALAVPKDVELTTHQNLLIRLLTRRVAARRLQRWWRVSRVHYCEHMTAIPFRRGVVDGIVEYVCGTKEEWRYGMFISRNHSTCQDDLCICDDVWYGEYGTYGCCGAECINKS